eukprot:Mycagemm_TRINITY_DN8816_c0_g1::TRINITY_DN8816_c0_g1_i1::g.1883::m.1883 type:complete len:125 gc:universal TRINITY_DN8816_c0_g1_i1:388-14(-)
MTTDVVERLELPVPIAHREYRVAGKVDGTECARQLQVSGESNAHPFLGEDCLAVTLVGRVRHVTLRVERERSAWYKTVSAILQQWQDHIRVSCLQRWGCCWRGAVGASAGGARSLPSRRARGNS